MFDSRYLPLLTTLVLTTSVTADDHGRVREWRQQGVILPLEKVLEKIPSHLDGRILEVELEGDRRRPIYEVEILDQQGRVWELKLDARSGELLDRELDD